MLGRKVFVVDETQVVAGSGASMQNEGKGIAPGNRKRTSAQA
jgi:hypothetical protein